MFWADIGCVVAPWVRRPGACSIPSGLPLPFGAALRPDIGPVDSEVFSIFLLDQRSLTIALGAVALFAWAQQYVCHLPQSAEHEAGAVPHFSLIIYLVHVLFLLLLRKFSISIYALPLVFGLLFLAAGTLFLCFAFTALLRHIPIIRRFV